MNKNLNSVGMLPATTVHTTLFVVMCFRYSLLILKSHDLLACNYNSIYDEAIALHVLIFNVSILELDIYIALLNSWPCYILWLYGYFDGCITLNPPPPPPLTTALLFYDASLDGVCKSG